MGVHRFARALDHMQCKLLDKQGRKSITEEVKITKFHYNIPDVMQKSHYNIPDVIQKSIIPHLTDDMSFNDILTKSEQ